MTRTARIQKKKTEPHQKRFRFMVVGICLFFVAMGLRLVHLQVVSAGSLQSQASEQQSLYQKLTPNRGEILITDKFSSQPYPVATSVEQRSLFANPSIIKNADELAGQLAEILKIEKEEILSKVSDSKKKYVLIKRQLSEEEEQKIKDSTLQGLILDPETVRYYPEKEFLGQLLGYVGFQGDQRVGSYGLEQALEKQLAGEGGVLDLEKDTGGAWIFGGRRNYVPPKNGDSFVLTIDKSIQFKAESILKDQVKKYSADSGSMVIMNAKTGAVMAMANYPSFDPNQYSKVDSLSIFNNLSTIGNYEPGSVFKPLTMAAAIDQNVVSPDTTYVDKGFEVIDDYTIKNSEPDPYGKQTMTQVLEQSINTGMIFVENKLGDAKFLDYVKKFGFGKPTGIEVAEGKGDLGNLDGNIRVNYATASFGQGISVTPIQLMQAYTALANRGVMMKPHVIQNRITVGGKNEQTEPEEAGRVISEKTAGTVTAMLVNVVENGHGKKAGVPGYYVAGKTGTAQVARADGRGYEANNYTGTFIGYAPANDPEFVMMVRVNRPRTVIFAESSAAPAFGEMARFLFNYLNIPPTREIK